MIKRNGIVEGESIIALDLSYSIVNFGYARAFISDSAEETLKFLEEGIPDLILMDIELRGDVNGLQLANRINQDYNLPIIFFTAF